ncbi:YggS family pyridoxal phosphate-dependent enzyme [candidate division WOR-3 bacterium]|nr:YggS family pyridoxal phosphate-dependent enzyme [candidate division WOR-3 bacterium]
MGIRENVRAILKKLPEGIILEAAIKTKTTKEILEAIDAGIKIVGDNYAQEMENRYKEIGNKVKWHFIGHPQKNKVRKLVKFVSLIETIDSIKLAEEINKRCSALDKVMPVLVEVNSGKEIQKAGVFPENTEKLIIEISKLPHIKVLGLMTMGPRFGNPEDSRPYFIETKKVFEKIKTLKLPNIEMKYLSMGMTNSYKIAIEEGANIVRIGTLIFGERK